MSVSKGLNKLWYTHTTENYATVEKKLKLFMYLHRTTSKIQQVEKTRYKTGYIVCYYSYKIMENT